MRSWEPQSDGVTDRPLARKIVAQSGNIDTNGDIVDLVRTLHERLREAIADDAPLVSEPDPRGVV